MLGLSIYSLCICTFFSQIDGRILPRIRHGRDAVPNEFPYMVIVRAGPYLCGGSIIGPQWILTAGHCIYPEIPLNDTAILYGSIHMEKAKIAHVAKAYRHEDYIHLVTVVNDNLIEHVWNDIGLYQLRENLPIGNPNVKLVSLPNVNEKIPSHDGTLLGWGATQSGYFSSILQVVNVTVYHCSIYFVLNICSTTDISGADHGDSGGPLIVSGKQYGIMSLLGPGTDDPAVISNIFTYIFQHREWIRNKTNI